MPSMVNQSLNKLVQNPHFRDQRYTAIITIESIYEIVIRIITYYAVNCFIAVYQVERIFLGP